MEKAANTPEGQRKTVKKDLPDMALSSTSAFPVPRSIKHFDFNKIQASGVVCMAIVYPRFRPGKKTGTSPGSIHI